MNGQAFKAIMYGFIFIFGRRTIEAHTVLDINSRQETTDVI